MTGRKGEEFKENASDRRPLLALFGPLGSEESSQNFQHCPTTMASDLRAGEIAISENLKPAGDSQRAGTRRRSSFAFRCFDSGKASQRVQPKRDLSFRSKLGRVYGVTRNRSMEGGSFTSTVQNDDRFTSLF